jgi:hypothetical protein
MKIYIKINLKQGKNKIKINFLKAFLKRKNK